MTYISRPRPKSQHFIPKEKSMKKFVFVPAVVAALSIPLAPVSQAAPCKFPSGASWCAVRDEGSLSPYEGKGPRSGKTDAADGTEPAIRFRIPGWKAPVQKRAAGDGVTAPIRWR